MGTSSDSSNCHSGMLADTRNLFISPHPDDACFSLGHLIKKNCGGNLLTVFPGSVYKVDQFSVGRENFRRVTQERHAEDLAFAKACNLHLTSLEFSDAMARGIDSFDQRNIASTINLIERRLLDVIVGLNADNPPNSKIRPWLFCPSGIGGHVDHIAVMMTVVRQLPLINKYYRVAFYEDLYYASDKAMRDLGLSRLFCVLDPIKLKRQILGLEKQECFDKMALVRLYTSQIDGGLKDIKAFQPAAAESFIHEAVWLSTGDMIHALG